MRYGTRIVIIAVMLASLDLATAAQNQPLKFEVASIKKGDPNSRQVGIHLVGRN